MNPHPYVQWQGWRNARLKSLSYPYGWLSLTAMHWLTGEPTGYPEITGRWHAGPGGITIEATAADGLTLARQPIDGTVTVDPAPDGLGVEVRLGDKAIEAFRRGDAYAIRVRDPKSPALVDFAGVPTYPFAERWMVAARFEPLAQPQTVSVGASVDGLTLRRVAVGTLHFTVGATVCRLTAFADGDGLQVLFRDATSGVTTYGGMRVLYPGTPSDGTITLDFNRAINMPCAFTDFATCPLPPPENVLPLAIEAGEQKPD